MTIRCAPTVALHHCDSFLSSGIRHIDYQDCRTFAREEQRRLPADAAAGAGNEGCLVFQSHGLLIGHR
jgi:hypothetical protein